MVSDGEKRRKRIAVFNCHEAWVHMLGSTDYDLDIVVGLKGQYKQFWDDQMRPLPANARVVGLAEVLGASDDYYCIIAHNMSDLLDIRDWNGPRLVVLHSTLEGRVLEERSDIRPDQMAGMMKQYLSLVRGHSVAVSKLKADSWGITDDIVSIAADPDAYPAFTGEIASGLRICNFIQSRKKILSWDLHEKAFANVPVRLVGHNPDLPGINAASSWDQLKKMLQCHRFYIHTADPILEDGYNMATLEAMAAGMPILGNAHPGSPIEHGVSGFLSDDPQRLGEYAQMLLADRELAVKMGAAARKTAIEKFSINTFARGITNSIEKARKKWLSQIAV